MAARLPLLPGGGAFKAGPPASAATPHAAEGAAQAAASTEATDVHIRPAACVRQARPPALALPAAGATNAPAQVSAGSARRRLCCRRRVPDNSMPSFLDLSGASSRRSPEARRCYLTRGFCCFRGRGRRGDSAGSSFLSTETGDEEEAREGAPSSDSARTLAAVGRMLFRHIAEGNAEEAERGNSLPASCACDGALSGRASLGNSVAASAGSARGTPLTTADFDEALFLEKQRCWECPFRASRARRSSLRGPRRCFLFGLGRRSRVTARDVRDLLEAIAAATRFDQEIAVLSAIYVERLLEKNPAVRLTKSSWRPILVAAMHLAFKTWEDVHPWNAEFVAWLSQDVGVRYPAQRLHVLELRFLVGLGYRVDVSGELYAAYLFSLRDDGQRTPPNAGSCVDLNRSRSMDAVMVGALDMSIASAGDDDSTPSVTSQTAEPTPRGTTPRTAAPCNSARGLLRTGRAGLFRRQVSDSGASMRALEKRRQAIEAYNESVLTMASTMVSEDLNASAIGGEEAVEWRLQHSARALRTLQLDHRNPHVGFFRHAPRAAPPSEHIRPRRHCNTASLPLKSSAFNM